MLIPICSNMRIAQETEDFEGSIPEFYRRAVKECIFESVALSHQRIDLEQRFRENKEFHKKSYYFQTYQNHISISESIVNLNSCLDK